MMKKERTGSVASYRTEFSEFIRDFWIAGYIKIRKNFRDTFR